MLMANAIVIRHLLDANIDSCFFVWQTLIFFPNTPFKFKAKSRKRSILVK
jgi:hypothetical protein